MSRWLKIVLGVLAGIIVLLVLNAIAVSQQTEDAEVDVDGAELVETSYGALQVLDEGDPQDSPIVLIHCYTCSMNWWGQLAPMLETGHRVIRVDLLGHGGSDKPGAGYEIEKQANAIAEALNELGVSGATVVGHSLGGTVATALAEQSPALVTKVVVVDQAPDSSFDDESLTQKLGYVPVIGQAMERLVQIAPSSQVRDQYEDVFAPGFNIASGFENPDEVVDDLREMTYTAFDEAAGAGEDYTDERPLDERLRGLELSLLVIFGAEDQVYDADEALERYAEIPGAQTQLIEGAGHSPNVEKPAEVAPLILAFVDQPSAAEQEQQRSEAEQQAQQEKAAAAARRKAKAQAAKKKAAAAKKKAGP
ncbi:MAG: alpha/beta fold hydrolase [Solirubrobacterales bacterium]